MSPAAPADRAQAVAPAVVVRPQPLQDRVIFDGERLKWIDRKTGAVVVLPELRR